MRILYIGDALVPDSGVTRKMLAQGRAWRDEGHDVWLATPHLVQPQALEVVDRVMAVPTAPTPPGSIVRRALRLADARLLNYRRLAQAARRLNIDVIYTRELAMEGLGRRHLLASRCVVLEITADAVHEARSAAKRRQVRRRRAGQLATAAGAVFVSEELRVACQPLTVPAIVIANGCAPPRLLDVAPPQRPALVLICNANHAWAGVDKFVRLARALPCFDFHLIGARIEGPDNLTCHGRMPEEQADSILARCTVGVGPLALHRKAMLEASPLKTRHYLSMGLPVLQSYDDTDMPADLLPVLQIPNTEDNVETHLDQIRAFVDMAAAGPGIQQAALELARGPLSAVHKERQRLAFFENLRHAS